MQTIFANDYHGVLYPATIKSKAMIVITGSDGGSKWANEIAATFASNGIPCFAISYWKEPGLPSNLSLIPIELIQSAAAWLNAQGYEKIGIYGVSKGAEFALTAASLLPQIEFIIAVSPACCVFEGIAKSKYSKTTSWTWSGVPLEYASFCHVKVNILKNIIRNREFGFSQQYSEVLSTEKNEQNSIKVENINGPILLISAEYDAQWPSKEMCLMIADRLEKKRFSFSFDHEIYHPASHIHCPVKTIRRFVYSIERKKPSECNAARKQALQYSLNWLARL